MSDEVKADGAAKAAIAGLQSTITTQFEETLRTLDTHGRTLSDQNHWAGPLADRFRSDTWPGVDSSLKKVIGELDDLRQQLARIHQNIMSAGGGA